MGLKILECENIGPRILFRASKLILRVRKFPNVYMELHTNLSLCNSVSEFDSNVACVQCRMIQFYFIQKISATFFSQ